MWCDFTVPRHWVRLQCRRQSASDEPGGEYGAKRKSAKRRLSAVSPENRHSKSGKFCKCLFRACVCYTSFSLEVSHARRFGFSVRGSTVS
jgi:hypothetical protein